TVNHSKGYDVAALLGEDAAVALAAAHERACRAVRRTVAREAVTRRRIDGVVTVVPAGGLEWALTTHATSRAGDPELHTHMALLSRVRADGASGWYAVWTTPLRASWHLAQTVADVTLACDPGLRRALGARGLVQRIDEDGTAHVDALEDAGRVLSKRHEQIARMREQMTAEWREAHGGVEPDAAARRAIDQAAWSRTRRSKTRETSTPDAAAWRAELAAAGHDLGVLAGAGLPAPVDVGRRISASDARDRAPIARAALVMLSRSSAVSLLDVQRAVWVACGRAVLAAGCAADEADLRRLVEWVGLDVQAGMQCLVPDGARAASAPWVRAWTTAQAMQEEAELLALCRALGEASVGRDAMPDTQGLDEAQAEAAQAVASSHGLVVVTGAAGSGKTTMLKAACDAMTYGPLLLSPTARGAQEMASSTGREATTVAGLLTRCGHRLTDAGWDDTRAVDAQPALRGRTIVVDEAGMIDQGSALRLMRIAHESGARLVLMGDEAQLGAVGRGGVMGIARGLCAPGATATLDVLHRYADPSWAALTLDARAGKEDVAERLAGREDDPVAGLECAGAISWGDDKQIADALARAWMDGRGTRKDDPDTLISCSTNAQAQAVNARAQALRAAAGELSEESVPGMDDERIHAGDVVQTRLNSPRLGVCNRDRWTVRRIHADDSLDLEAGARRVTVPADYAAEWVQLAYATTTYGCQGATARHAIHWAGQGAGSEDLYVGLSRGARDQRIVLTADTKDDAIEQVAHALTDSRADLGITTARAQAIADLDATPPVAPHTPAPSPAPDPKPADPDDEPDTDDETQKMRRYLVTHKDELYGLDLSGQDLHGLDLSGADLHGSRLDGANLQDADMTDADLSGAVLSGATMTAAYLPGARLDDAVMTDADMTDADMTGADCFRADMRGAVLSGARLDDTDMTDALLDGATMPDTSDSPARALPDTDTPTPGMSI
ncbi:AAA family ATPase, partial [Pseudoscardovia radai]|uniref:ATPase, T2SS/T4P/T4SS family n=1 Tax=Pseudoscardovia radai TaxID=987066 RepID=UPI0039911D03